MGPTGALVNELLPLLKANDVSLYICGHDHNLQYFTDTESDLKFVVAGAATAPNPSQKHRADIYESIKIYVFIVC